MLQQQKKYFKFYFSLVNEISSNYILKFAFDFTKRIAIFNKIETFQKNVLKNYIYINF